MGTTGTVPKKQTLYLCCNSESNSVQIGRGEERGRKEYRKLGPDPSLPPASRAMETKTSPFRAPSTHSQSGAEGQEVRKGLYAQP